MVLGNQTAMEDPMPQTVPSAGFTPPCDYSAFVCDFDVSLLTGEGNFSPNTTSFYAQSPDPQEKPRIYTSFYPTQPELTPPRLEEDLGPDFQKLLNNESDSNKYSSLTCGIYLDVPKASSPGSYHASSPIGAVSPYSQGLLSPNTDQYSSYSFPSSPESLKSVSSIYSNSPQESSSILQIKCEDGFANSFTYLNHSPQEQDQNNELDVFNLISESQTIDTKHIKQESTVDFSGLLTSYNQSGLRELLEAPPKRPKVEDHRLLRECLRDTSFQKKYNVKPLSLEFNILDEGGVKMETDENVLEEELAAPVLQIYMEQMKKDITSTCEKLSISPDPLQWSAKDVLSWLEWTSREFGLPKPVPEQWSMDGASLTNLSEEDFNNRCPQGGVKLYAQLELWKAAFLESEMNMKWLPETTTCPSNGEISDDDEEETSPSDTTKPTTSRAGSHIHLWQFLKELLASPQTHGHCIRWLDRPKGVFKIEDSVKVARLWGKRKNRPAMNYDKLSRSIRQYYKKGIMKKTERSQRLVYQFCHPYSL